MPMQMNCSIYHHHDRCRRRPIGRFLIFQALISFNGLLSLSLIDEEIDLKLMWLTLLFPFEIDRISFQIYSSTFFLNPTEFPQPRIFAQIGLFFSIGLIRFPLLINCN